LVSELVSTTGKPLSQLVSERMAAYPCSGEINSKLSNPKAVIDGITKLYSEGATSIDHTDGISINYDNWRFNLRSSNTEPVVRLNVESKGDQALMEEKTNELLNKIKELDK